MELEFNIKGQEITRLDDDKYLVQDSKNYVQVKLNFLTEEWEGLQKYVILKTRFKNYNYPLGLGDTFSFILPDIVLTGEFFRIGVYGSYYDYIEETETLIPTDECIIILKESVYTQDISPTSDVPEDIFNTVMRELEEKVDKVEGKGLSTNDYTDEDKAKVDNFGIIVDDELSTTSINPVQNNVITTNLQTKAEIVHEHVTADVIDFESSVDVDLDKLLSDLTEKVREL